MAIEQLINFARGDIFPAFDDQLFEPPCDKHIALVVDFGQIPSAQPTISKGARGGLRVFKVFQHHVGAANNDLAFGIWRQWRAVRIVDFNLAAHSAPR